MGCNVKVGDLVRNIYTGEIGLVTRVDSEDLYVDVDWKHLVPEEHLMVIIESRSFGTLDKTFLYFGWREAIPYYESLWHFRTVFTLLVFKQSGFLKRTIGGSKCK